MGSGWLPRGVVDGRWCRRRELEAYRLVGGRGFAASATFCLRMRGQPCVRVRPPCLAERSGMKRMYGLSRAMMEGDRAPCGRTDGITQDGSRWKWDKVMQRPDRVKVHEGGREVRGRAGSEVSTSR